MFADIRHYRFLFLLFTCISCHSIASQNKIIFEFQDVWLNFLQNKAIDYREIENEMNRHYEFSLLEEFSDQQISRSRPFNQMMDRYDDGCPYNENKITLVDGTEMSASKIQLSSNSLNTHTFIATQAPFQHNIDLFWKMIEENHIDQIVMLTELFESPSSEMCYAYWPRKNDEKLILENGIEITLIEEYDILSELCEFIQIRKFLLHTPEIEREITHYWYRNWKNDRVPLEIQTLLTLLNLVEKDKKENRSLSPILVHCSGGMGRAGVFMTLYHFMQRVKLGDTVSLFDLIAFLRWQRPYAVCVLDQYQFIHQISHEIKKNKTGLMKSQHNIRAIK